MSQAALIEAPSLIEDPAYPELLRDLASVVSRELRAIGIEAEYSDAVACTVAEHVREHFGGVPQYWPKGADHQRVRRRRQMWLDFTGDNHAELARKYGMCLQQVYKTLAIARAEHLRRTQHDMFDG